jgi:hypothetical protein
MIVMKPEKTVTKHVSHDAKRHVTKIVEEHAVPEPRPDQKSLESSAADAYARIISLLGSPEAAPSQGGPLSLTVWSPWVREDTRKELGAAITARLRQAKLYSGLFRAGRWTELTLTVTHESLQDAPAVSAIARPPRAPVTPTTRRLGFR